MPMLLKHQHDKRCSPDAPEPQSKSLTGDSMQGSRSPEPLAVEAKALDDAEKALDVKRAELATLERRYREELQPKLASAGKD